MRKELPNCYVNRHGIYYLRIAVPKIIRTAFSVRKTSIRKSLGTKQRQQAKLRSWALLHALSMLFEEFGARAMSNRGKWTEDELRARNERDAQRFMEALEAIEKCDPLNAQDYDPDSIMSVRDQMDAIAGTERERADLEQSRQLEERLKSYVREEMLGISGNSSTSASSTSAPSHSNALLATYTPTSATARSISSVLESLAEYKRNTGVWRNAKTYTSNLNQLKLIAEILGDPQHRSFCSLTIEDIASCSEKLQRLPKGTTAGNVVTKLRSPSPDDARISSQTVSEKITLLKQLCRYAYENNYHESDLAGRIRYTIPKREKAKNKYETLTTQQLEALFGCWVYKCQLPKGQSKKDVRNFYFWLPLLGAFTGARLAELCQLHTGDVKICGDTQIPYLDLNDADDKSIKTESGHRQVPLHPKLLELGFMSFVSEQDAKGEQRLFPEIFETRSGGPTSTNKASKWFGRLTVKIGLRGSKDRGVVFHSLRHTFVDNLKQQGIELDKIADLVGHETGLITAHYGRKRGLEAMLEVMKRVDYGIDLAHVRFSSFEQLKPSARPTPKKARVRRKRQIAK